MHQIITGSAARHNSGVRHNFRADCIMVKHCQILKWKNNFLIQVSGFCNLKKLCKDVQHKNNQYEDIKIMRM